ncbi:MAG: radical SAM protein, partial [Desulfobacteraceae bacterium]|nr:radical SAM protein [Desulfobacteraceae bacterium]
VYKTAMTFQLSSGCSNFCRRCNEWALPKIRSHFSYQAILKIIDHMVELRNDEISLYGASDPLDWKHDNKTIFNVLKKLKKLPIECSILTKVPKGKEPLLKTLIKHKANLSVSVTSQNKSRINKIEQEFDHPIGKQHDLDELLIPAGLDEDFISIKPSITDGYGTEITPDGAFIIIPTFTSALHPFGHKKLPITSKTAFFPVKKTGRKALLVDYFKPLEGYDLNQNRFFLSFLLDVQIESIILDNGTDELTPPGMRSIKEYLSIFEKTAMIQRKKMTLSVLKKLKKQFLARVSFKDLSESKKALYLKKISAHLNLCKKDNCLLAKLHAVSFFLESIFYYKQNHSTKLKMIQFLLKDEIRLSFANPPAITGEKCVEKNLTAPHFDSFDIFRYYVFYLLFKSDDNTILSFIKAYPSIYDSQIDIFIHL